MIKQCVPEVLLLWLDVPANPNSDILHAGKFYGDREKRRMQD